MLRAEILQARQKKKLVMEVIVFKSQIERVNSQSMMNFL